MTHSTPESRGGATGALVAVFVPGRPVTQGSMRVLSRGRMTHDNPRLRGWRKAVGWMARSALGAQPPTDDAVVVRCHFCLAPTRRSDAPDLDKLVRAVLDALTGVVFTDDKQVVALDARRTMAWSAREVRLFEAEVARLAPGTPLDAIPEGVLLVVERA